MKKRPSRKAFSFNAQTSFNWQLQDDESRTQQPLADAPAPRSAPSWLTLSVAALVILLAGFWVGQRLIQRAEANLAEVEAEVAHAIQQQNRLQRPQIAATDTFTLAQGIANTATNVASNGPTSWGEQVTLIELNGTLALVDVLVRNAAEAWHTEPYHVARVMRQEGSGWKTISPINAFWNDQRTLETAYFRLEFSQRDERAVREIAPHLDDFYLRLHNDLGIPPPKRNTRLHILLSVAEGSEVRVTDLRYSGNTLIVPPPELLPRPVAISNAETLRQAITFPLTVKIVDAAQSQLPDACNWRAVREGIGLWLRWEGHTLPSRRHWEYQRVIDEWSNPAAPPRLDDLLSIPRDCWQPPPFLEMEVLNSGTPLPRAELSATLIEFAVAEYGRQFLPILLHEIGNFSSWDDLAQATFQLSADELEADWQRYLAARAP